MRRLISVAAALVLAAGVLLAGTGSAGAAPARPADTYTLWWSAKSSVPIGDVWYDLHFELWRDNQNGRWHVHETGYPAGWVGIYDLSNKLIPGTGASKRPGWFDVNGGETSWGTVQACGQAVPPSDGQTYGPVVCSGYTT